MWVFQLTMGTLLAGLVAGMGRRLGALSGSGMWAAVLIGGLTYGLGGLRAAILLLAFFFTSSGFSRLGQARKQPLTRSFAKGRQRDAGQVMANGSLAAALAVWIGIQPHPQIWAAFAGALAAVTADTWATEVGVLSGRRPRLITTGRPVEAGVSGAVTPEGSLAALAGAGAMGMLGGLLGRSAVAGLAAALGGVVGTGVDSFLGASLQAMHYCPVCDKQTEQHPTHLCGARTHRVRGWSWLNNDVVNFLASLAGASTAAVTWAFLAS